MGLEYFEMKSNAPGQLLGYVLQLQRALVYLLQAGSGSSVCVEVFGDVGVISGDKRISEEDKSSISSNPVTDRSIELWKTFSNWLQAIHDGDIDIENTKFFIYSNYPGQDGIVNGLSRANTLEDAQKCITDIKRKLQDIDEEHVIYPYLQEVYKNKDLATKLIINFEFILGSKCSQDEVHQELRRMVLPEAYFTYIHDELLGWLTNNVMSKISSKQKAIILWEELEKKASNIFQRARSKELIDFTTKKSSVDPDVREQLNTYPYYLQQLKIINLDEDQQIQAISDFLRSKVNIQRWIEGGLIDEDIAVDFEEKLKRYWENLSKRIAVMNKLKEPKERGLLVYLDCMDRQETISNQRPPACITAGVYHTLANTDQIGWHEDWKRILKKINSESINV